MQEKIMTLSPSRRRIQKRNADVLREWKAGRAEGLPATQLRVFLESKYGICTGTFYQIIRNNGNGTDNAAN